MSKCVQCGKEYEAKRSTSSYCSAKCKQEFYRNRITVTPVTVKSVSVTDDTVKSFSVTDLEKCRYCGVLLPKLLKPRKYPGACYKCALEHPTKLEGHTTNRVTDKPKCGKDIKCFEDLPPDVQQTIEILSDNEEEKKRRTGIAIHYQHIFPERYSIF